MNRLIVAAIFAVGLLSACGGPIDEEQQAQAAATSSELRAEAPPPLQPVDPMRPVTIVGLAEPTIVFDFSDGRINARLNAPPPEARALYDTHIGGRCGCRH